MKSFFGILAMLAMLVGGTPAQASQSKLQVLVFAAPWCSICHEMLPELQDLVDEQLASHKGQFEVTVYIETGYTANSRPTQKDAVQYARELGLSFNVVPDQWRWKTYRKYLEADYSVPGAVVLDANGEVLKTFEPGTLSAEELVSYVSRALNSR